MMDTKLQKLDELICSNMTDCLEKFDVASHYQDKFRRMQAVGALTAECLTWLAYAIAPGISTLDIDAFVREFAEANGLGLACLGYRGFPAACCTSVNHQIVHAIPSKKLLKDGDIVKVDVTFIKDGWHGDSCRTFLVGTGHNPKVEKLVRVARQALQEGIQKAQAGNTVGHISRAIQAYVEGQGLSVVRDFMGHGIGIKFHCSPHIPHYYDADHPYINYMLYPGDTFTIEPMVNLGRPDYKVLNDKWTVVTRDRSWSAQFEHTLGILNTGNVIFTA